MKIFAVLLIIALAQATTIECELCDFVVGKVEEYLQANKTETEIVKELDYVCDLFPLHFASKCEFIVANYIGRIINNLEKEFPPELICELISLCPKSHHFGECELCEWIVGMVESWVASNSTGKQIEADLEKVCAYLPSQYVSVCDNLVMRLPLIVSYLEERYTPEVICGLAEYCEA